jgi:hypothetical protein
VTAAILSQQSLKEAFSARWNSTRITNEIMREQTSVLVYARKIFIILLMVE